MNNNIPTISLGLGMGTGPGKVELKRRTQKLKAAKGKAHTKPKVKAKSVSPRQGKPKPSAKARRTTSKTRTRTKPLREDSGLGQVPASLAPPEIKDTRPVKAKDEVKWSKPPGDPEKFPELTVHTKTAPTAPAARTPRPDDHKLVQGATCVWVGTLGDALREAGDDEALCPHCTGHLIEVPGGLDSLMLGLESYELGAYSAVNPAPRPHPGYRKMMVWAMDKFKAQCWSTPEDLADSYHEATGVRVDPTR
jgi:hypothetical protein